MEAELIELRSSNLRLRDAEVASGREVQQLKDRNTTLMNENEHMRNQIRSQEEAI